VFIFGVLNCLQNKNFKEADTYSNAFIMSRDGRDVITLCWFVGLLLLVADFL
jgi:hypothetical protein